MYRRTNVDLAMRAVMDFVSRLQKSVICWHAYFTTGCNRLCENNKQKRKHTPGPPVAFYAARFRGIAGGNCIGLSYLNHKIKVT